MNKLTSKIIPYKPSIILVLLAWLFVIFPSLAVFLISGALLSLAIVYAYIVHSSQKIKEYKRNTADTFNEQGEPESSPDFRKTVIKIIEGERWM